MRRPGPIRDALIAGIAVAKAGAAIILTLLILLLHPAPLTPSHWPKIILTLVFGVIGLFLTSYGWVNTRARNLGIAFLLIASVFADPILRLLDQPGYWGLPSPPLFAIQVDALLGWYAWRFAMEFPRLVQPRVSAVQLGRLTLRITGAVGLLLLLVNLPIGSWVTESTATWAWSLARANPASLYWPAIYIPCALALFTIGFRAHLAAPDERRRVRLAVWGIVAGASPMVVWTVGVVVSPRFEAALPLQTAGWIIYPGLLFCGIATSYAVMAQQALAMRFVVRRAVQYAFARYSVLVLAVIPLIVLAGFAFRHRSEPTSAVLFTGRTVALLATSVCLFTAMQLRRGILAQLDRMFFRDHWDARRLLHSLRDDCRWVDSDTELATIVRSGIAGAIHPAQVELLLLNPEGDSFTSPLGDAPTVARGSPLVASLAGTDRVMDLHPLPGDATHSPALAAELARLAEAHVHYVLPLRHADLTLVGMLLLGPRLSEEPYSPEDWEQLTSVVIAAEMAVGFHALRMSVPRAAPVAIASREQPARECPACGTVGVSTETTCTVCGAVTAPCRLPRTIAEKFRIDQRIGAGGMGIVYRGSDLTLDRPIAIKTLPHASPSGALRLAREARTMAQVSHPHLAIVFGADSWNGQPYLLVEYLAGGTLADRLESGPLPIPDALELGVSLASALGALHASGVLHCDIKPSNIGYTEHGVPKLLDFGLARITERGALQLPGAAAAMMAGGTSITADDSTLRRGGTLLYASPERLGGQPHAPRLDLWSLALVLYEAIAGQHPFRGSTIDATSEKILMADTPDLRTFVPHAGKRVAAFFSGALARHPAARPQTATEMLERLRTLAARESRTIRPARAISPLES